MWNRVDRVTFVDFRVRIFHETTLLALTRAAAQWSLESPEIWARREVARVRPTRASRMSRHRHILPPLTLFPRRGCGVGRRWVRPARTSHGELGAACRFTRLVRIGVR